MQLTLMQLQQAAPSLKALSETKLPAKASYRLARIINKVESCLQDSEKVRLSIAQRLGTLSEDGQSYKIEGENLSQFQTEMEDLLKIENSFEHELLDIEAIGEVEIEAVHIARLIGIIFKES